MKDKSRDSQKKKNPASNSKTLNQRKTRRGKEYVVERYLVDPFADLDWMAVSYNANRRKFDKSAD